MELHKRVKGPVANRGSRGFEKREVVKRVVHVQQNAQRHLAALRQVVQVRPGVVFARRALTVCH